MESRLLSVYAMPLWQDLMLLVDASSGKHHLVISTVSVILLLKEMTSIFQPPMLVRALKVHLSQVLSCLSWIAPPVIFNGK